MTPRRYIIVGNGPAGLTAAETIRLADADADIRVVAGEPHRFYSRPGLAYYLADILPEERVFSRPDADYKDARIERTTGTAEALDRERHRVLLADGAVLPYDRLLLAVGARAVKPPTPGMDLAGVVTLDSLDDARAMIRLARTAKRACVVGGGITALELAEGLAARGVETHYLMRGDRYWASVLDPHESEMVEERLTHDGIRVHPGVEIARVIGRDGRVVGVETTSGDQLACELLGVAIGTQARVELAKAAGLDTGRGIWTDATFATSDPDIYAAGDVAEMLDPGSGKRSLEALWSVALAQGRVAGANIAGAAQQYRKAAPFNVTKLGGLTTTIIGSVGTGGREGDLVTLARGDSDAWREQLDAFAVVADAGANHLRLVLGEDRIVGAVVMGDQALTRPLLHLIRERIDIRSVRDRLLAQPGDIRQSIAAIMERMVPIGAA
jgi:NAD(P)H-nitrite reductase large subunit